MKKFRRSFKGAALAALLSSCAAAAAVTAPAPARQDSTNERLMELNRSGRWAEAARLAQSYLKAEGPKPLAQKCEVYYDLAYAQTRLGRVEDALASLALYERECRNLPAGWLATEVPRLRAELTAAPAAARPRQPQSEDDFWQTADPSSLGMNVEALERHQELCARTGADACLVVYKGKIVQERYYAGYVEPAGAMSSTKSVTGLLFGMLLDEGKIKSVDEPVCNYLKAWCAGQKGKVTLRHLLTMTSGLPNLNEDGVGFVADKNPFVTSLPLATEPGAVWAYSNEGVQLLSPILDEAAGEPIQDYARRRLFGPLGMRATGFHLDEKGHAWTYADLKTTPRDFARIGLLMLGKGVWRGKRVVSESWVEQSTRPSQALNPRYGLLWWLFESPRGYAAIGYLDTNLYVFPGKELVVVRMQSRPLAGQPSYQDEALRLFEQFTRR